MIRTALFANASRARVGRFELRGKLGQGGMASVLRAFDETLNRDVAVKLLHRDLSREHNKRLLREAQALARLSHPNVVQVGESDGETFIAMELVRGNRSAATGHAERAVASDEGHQGPPHAVADARFVLARALGSEPKHAERARTLAARVLEDLSNAGPSGTGRIGRIEAWLASQGVHTTTGPG